MWIVKRKTLQDYWLKHRNCEQYLKEWFHIAKKAHWNSIADIKKLYPSADLVGSDKVVFNVKGNHYRLIVKINFKHNKIWIKFIGTHAEYDKIDVTSL